MKTWIRVGISYALLSLTWAGASGKEDKGPAQAFQCASCGQGVQRGYVQALGKVWHPEHFVCGICDQNLQGEAFVQHEGQPYHQACYLERFAPRCAGCDHPIKGRYITAMEGKWHPHHFVCAVCQRPIVGSKFVERDNHPYHEACAAREFNPRCQICLEPVTDHYLTNFWDDKYCQYHEDELPQCYGCGRLVSKQLTDGGVRFEDGRTICNQCRRTGIDSVEEAEALGRQVATTMAELGFVISPASFPLRLVDQREMAREESHGDRTSGSTKMVVETLDGRVVERGVAEILMLHGLPAEYFAATYAHELGHAWLFQQRFLQLPPLVEEGICELFAHLWLQKRPGGWSDYLIYSKERSSDPVYGEGYRAAVRSLGQMTRAELLDYVKQHQKFPRPSASAPRLPPR